MSQEPQSPRWPEAEIKTIPKRLPNESGSGDAAREPDAGKRVGSFGERLQRERELRAISLDEIAKSTKIGTRLLQALEAEEFDKLPGGIFNKGFVRAYAKYLGLDEEQAVTDYMAAENEKERARRSPSSSSGEERNISNPKLFAIQGGSRPDNVYNIRASAEALEQDPPQANGFLIAAVILVFVLGIGGFGWKYYSAHSGAKGALPVSEQPANPIPAVQTPQPAPIQAQPSTTSTDSATPTTTTPAQISDASIAPAKSATDSSSALKKPDSVTAKPTDASADANLISPNETSTKSSQLGAFTLDLRAEEQSWVQISSEGKVLWSGLVNKDDTKTFHATKEMIVKLGNAPGVELSYNGKPLPRFSQDAKTRTLTFTSQGLTPQ